VPHTKEGQPCRTLNSPYPSDHVGRDRRAQALAGGADAPGERWDAVLARLENTDSAIRRLVEKLDGSEALAVCHDAGSGGHELG
jgi:broad specificity phosphatase PhoE